MAEGHTSKHHVIQSGSNHSSEYLSVSEESLERDNNIKPHADATEGKLSPKQQSDRKTDTRRRNESKRMIGNTREQHATTLNSSREHTAVKSVFCSTLPKRNNIFGNNPVCHSDSSLKPNCRSAASNQFQQDEEWDFTGMSTHAFVDTNFRFVTITPSSSLEDQVSPTYQAHLYRDVPSRVDHWTAGEKEYLLGVMAIALASKAITAAQEELLVLTGQYPYTLNKKMSSILRDPAINLPLMKTLFGKFAQKHDRYSNQLRKCAKSGWMSLPPKYQKEKSSTQFSKEIKIDTAKGFPVNGDSMTASSRGFVHRGDTYNIADQVINVEFVRERQPQTFCVPPSFSTITTEDSYEAIDDALCSTKRPDTCNRTAALFSTPNQSAISLSRATAKTDMMEDQGSLASCSYYLEANFSRPTTSNTEDLGSGNNESYSIGNLRIRQCQPNLVLSDSITERYSLAGSPRTSVSAQYDTPDSGTRQSDACCRKTVKSNITDFMGCNRHPHKHIVENEDVFSTEGLDDDTNSELHQSQIHIESLQGIPPIYLNFNSPEHLPQEPCSSGQTEPEFTHANACGIEKESQSTFSNQLSDFLEYGQRSRRYYGRSTTDTTHTSDTGVTSRQKSRKSSGSRRRSDECYLRVREDVMPYDPGIRSVSQPLDTDGYGSDQTHSGHRHRSRASHFDPHKRQKKPDSRPHRKSKPKIECTNCRQPIFSDHGTLPGESYCSDSSTCKSVSPPLALRRRDSGVTLGVVLVKSSKAKVKHSKGGGPTVLDF